MENENMDNNWLELSSSTLEEQIVPMSQNLVEIIRMVEDVDNVLIRRESIPDNPNASSDSMDFDEEEDETERKFIAATRKAVSELVKEKKEAVKPRAEVHYEMCKDFKTFLSKAKASKVLTDKNCKDLTKLCDNGWVLKPSIKLPAELRKLLTEIGVLKSGN